MNRWCQRLAELQGDSSEPAMLPRAVQNDQNLQNPASDPVFEHFEQSERRKEPPAPPIPPALDRESSHWREAEDERAAIVEHDGRIPRTWAEGLARLHPDCPPADVPLRRWHQFVDDLGRFLDSSFCAVAVALGWEPLDLFGCDRDRPFARIDCAGLLWLLRGDKLIALTENTAAIETLTGARQIYRRKPGEPGRALAWELAP